jgi:hypothetical protein
MYIKPKYFYALVMFCILLCVRFFIPPTNFADYYSYELIISNSPSIFDNSLYEWLSYSTFSIMGGLRLLGVDPVYWSYVYHFLFTAVLFFWLFRASNSTLTGVVLVISLYAPLFSFVILRAAPAYLIIALSVFYCTHGMKKVSSILALISVFYHISAILPAMVILFLNIAGFRLLKLSNLIFKIAMTVAIFQLINFWLRIDLMPSGIKELISGYELIEKYSVYADAPVDGSIYHIVYFLACSLMVALAKIKNKFISEYLLLYSFILFGVCAILIISPATSFRMSVFYFLPLLLIFPWHSFLSGVVTYIIFAVSPFLLYFSFNGIISQ